MTRIVTVVLALALAAGALATGAAARLHTGKASATQSTICFPPKNNRRGFCWPPE